MCTSALPMRDRQRLRAGAANDENARLSAGQWIGERYAAIRPLGVGGTATVWEVEDPSTSRRYALKVLHDPRSVPDVVLARFEREARAATFIQHPNVVRVVDHDVDATVGPFIVMELLLGEALSRLMEPGLAFSLQQTIAWLDPIASALDAMHAAGLVHRDVKPENIVQVDDATVKLVDLGLAIHADGRDRLTRKGALVGTPHYMAPEAAEGGTLTAAADVYSLAVVAYELLAGEPPHDGSSAMEILSSKVVSPAPSLFERTGRMFTVAIELAFADALDRDPCARPATASAFIRRLSGPMKAPAVDARVPAVDEPLDEGPSADGRGA